MNLTRTNWPLGWVPNNDAVNGNPDGLLRMDNLRIDKNGLVSLVDGHQQISSASDFVTKIHSKIQNGIEYLWLAYGTPVVQIYRSSGLSGFNTDMAVPGAGFPSAAAAFGDAFNYTLAMSGTLRTKDPITSAPLPLGIQTPSLINGRGPAIHVNSQLSILVPAPDQVVTGSSGGLFTVNLDPTFFTGAMASSAPFNLNSTSIGGAASSQPASDVFEFPFTVIQKPTDIITRVVLNFLLDGTPNDQATYGNYYEFNFEGAELQNGISTRALLSKQRSQAIRFGNNTALDWTHVIGVRFMVVATEAATVKFGNITIIGGISGNLDGVYNYIQQDVYNDGTYVAKSPVSELGYNSATSTFITEIKVTKGSVVITPVLNDTHVTDHYFYRRADPNQGVNPDTGESNNNSSLLNYNFVGSSKRGVAFTDIQSDTDILELNADGSLFPNLFLKTMAVTDTTNGLADFIYGIEGLHHDRMLYMGQSYVYVSDRLNPDAVDTRFTLKPSGDTSEKNLWVKRLTNNTVILGTTKNLYEISGTWAELPDGTLDINLIPIGEQFPPLSTDVCHYDNGLYYVAVDGLRVTAGSNSANVSPQLRQFFVNTVYVNAVRAIAVHGVPVAAIYDGIGVSYSVAAAHQKIYFVMPCQDGTRRLIYFDTVTKSYSLLFTDPILVYGSQGGELIASYGGANPSVWILDSAPGFGFGGTEGLNFKLRTVFDPNGQPRNRKDTFTLKLVLDTGGREISVDLQKDGIGVTETDEPNWINLGRVSANGQTTVYIPLSAATVTLGFRYALQLSDVNKVYIFKLFEATIEYEPRPEQLNYLRILPTNLGTISRKRWTAYAFVVDTLGGSSTFTPYLDNVAWGTTSTVSNGTKLTHIFYFASEAVATDMGGTLVADPGSIFEFYGLNLEECVSEKMPTPTTYLVIPANNYGTPNRKRHTSYKFQINTKGKTVVFTPQLDGTAYTGTSFITAAKRTVDYFFPQSAGDVIGIDIGGTLESAESPKIPFEFYGVVVPQTVETLPDRLEYLRIPNSNFGTANRKRIRTISLVLDTRGQAVTFTPYVDNQPFGISTTFTTTGKTTVWYYFNSDVVGVDFGGVLSTDSGGYFEFYGLGTPDNVEPLPLPVTYFIIPPNNYGTPDRKRHTSYKFQIITRANRVRFTPILDGISYSPTDYVTQGSATRQTIEYFFPAGDVIGIDIGGILESVDGVPFEFYETVVPQKLDILPERLQWLRLPNTNFGIPSRKRIRTIPIIIDTYGHDVTFYPIVDDTIAGAPTVFNTISKTTVYHFFVQDVFGTDFGGILSCDGTGQWLAQRQPGNTLSAPSGMDLIVNMDDVINMDEV